MENLTRDVYLYINNEMRLLEIIAENNILLERTKQLETKINQVKQRGETPCRKDKTVLDAMVSKSLYLLAERDTLKIVGTSLIRKHELLRMIHKRYQYLMDRFRQRLYYKRFQRLYNVERLHHIDFNIVQYI